MKPAIEHDAGAPEDLLGLFLMIARAARYQAPCPSIDDLARVYGTQSLGRVRRLVGYLEAQGVIATRTDFRGRQSRGSARHWHRPSPA